MHAEHEYLFRHAVVRDAAYGLQLPGRKAELHLLAADAVESLFGPEDAAAELADHLSVARELSGRHDQLEREKQMLRRAVKRAERHFDMRGALLRCLRLADLARGAERCEVLHKACVLARDGGFYAECEALYGQLRETGVASGHLQSQCRAALGLINLRIDLGRIQEAEQLFESAGWEASGTDGTRARLLSSLDRVPEAEAEFRRLIKLRHDAGEHNDEALVLGGLSALLIKSSRGAEGEPYLRAALDAAREADNLRMEGFWTGSLGVRLSNTGQLAEARSLMSRALQIARETGDRRSEGIWLAYLANRVMEAEGGAAAEQMFEQALSLSRELGDVERESLNLGNLAYLRMDQQQTSQAEEMLESALRLDRQAGNRRFEGAHLCDRAQLHLIRGNRQAAHVDWTNGAAMLRQLGDTESLSTCQREMRGRCERLGVAALT